MFRNRIDDSGRRIEPGIQNVGIDDLVSRRQLLELVTNGFEERATVVARVTRPKAHAP